MIHIPTEIKDKMQLEAGYLDDLSNAPCPAWSDTNIAFLNALSQALRSRPDGKAMPDIMSLSFWLRKANLSSIKQQSENKNALQIGLGLTFHISPSNVPVNFAYSLSFALLAGNSCVVRLPSNETQTSRILIEEIQSLLQTDAFHSLNNRLALIRYPHNDSVTQFWIAQADARVFWGGDETIQRMRQYSPPIRSREIAFADRYSIAIAHAPSVAKMTEFELQQAADKIYNDIYLMDQAACSSPQLFVWIGNEQEIADAKSALWTQVDLVAQQKYALSDSQAMSKYIDTCNLIMDIPDAYSVEQESLYLTRIQLSSLSTEQQSKRGYNGTVFEVALTHLDQLTHIVNERFQTLSYLGFSSEQLMQFISDKQLRGFDRVVPVGQALSMEHIWDGYDVIASLSRLIQTH